MPELQVIARYTVSEGKVDEVLSILPELQAAALGEEGCLAFDVFQQIDDPLNVILLERYASREALAAHRETEHFKEIVLGRIVPRLDSRTFDLFDITD